MDRRTVTADSDIRKGLQAAEARGLAMFDAIERAGIIRPGKTEKDVDNEIYILAKKDFGVDVHWHKRLVRAGINTVCVYAENPPSRMIGPDDTVFLDLGPLFAGANAQWEADLGRSYALGNDPEKKRLVADLPRLFDVVKAHFEATPDITLEELRTALARREITVGYGTLWRFFDRRGITRKKRRRMPPSKIARLS